MPSAMTQGRALAVAVAVAVLGAAAASAQCTHILGDPPPTAGALLSSKTVLKAASGGSFGDGNDRFKILKSAVPVSGAIDPTAGHNVHMTLRHTDANGPVMLDLSLPAGSPWVSPGPGKFRYNDGSIKMVLRDFGGHITYKIVGRHGSIANAPLLPGDTLHLTLQIEEAGVGDCLDMTMMLCTGTATSNICR